MPIDIQALIGEALAIRLGILDRDAAIRARELLKALRSTGHPNAGVFAATDHLRTELASFCSGRARWELPAALRPLARVAVTNMLPPSHEECRALGEYLAENGVLRSSHVHYLDASVPVVLGFFRELHSSTAFIYTGAEASVPPTYRPQAVVLGDAMIEAVAGLPLEPLDTALYEAVGTRSQRGMTRSFIDVYASRSDRRLARTTLAALAERAA